MAEDWLVVQVASDQVSAEMSVAFLQEEGIPARIKASDAVSFLGTSGFGCRVLVPADRLEEAASLLADHIEYEEPPEPA